jgi:hypothetical protein
MAAWDTDYCLARAKLLALRPATDQMMTDEKWCQFLTLGEEHWLPIFANKVPESQAGAPVQLTIAGDNRSATFAAGVWPEGHVSLYDGPNGRILTPGEYGDPGADFVIDGGLIRSPSGRTLNYPQGLYARYVDVSTRPLVSSSIATVDNPVANPRLMPERARILIVYHALGLYAAMGGFMDPAYWEHKEIVTAFDDVATGKVGILTELMTQYQDQGASSGAQYVWWKSSDLGNLRHSMHT